MRKDILMKKYTIKRKGSIKRKGQAEIIGLAMLVVILVVILVITLNFSFNLGNDPRSDIRKSLIANNLLNAIIKEQGKINIRELINDCYAENKRNVNNGQSCTNLKNEFNNLFSVVLGKTKYKMQIQTDELIFFEQGECERGIASIPYRFKEEGITFIANLRLC